MFLSSQENGFTTFGTRLDRPTDRSETFSALLQESEKATHVLSTFYQMSSVALRPLVLILGRAHVVSTRVAQQTPFLHCAAVHNVRVRQQSSWRRGGQGQNRAQQHSWGGGGGDGYSNNNHRSGQRNHWRRGRGGGGGRNRGSGHSRSSYQGIRIKPNRTLTPTTVKPDEVTTVEELAVGFF